MTARNKALIAAAVVALATPLTMQWEGKRNATYLDIGGVPTACYGQTGSQVQRGKTYSDATCRQWLNESLHAHYAGIRRCVTAPMADHQAAALTVWAYNVGVPAACGSTLVRHANAGNWPAACAQLDRWVYVRGQRVQGLANRRAAERGLCEGRQP
ncbi:lysozyme [Chitinibacteraceae bacterium HSL-7]